MLKNSKSWHPRISSLQFNPGIDLRISSLQFDPGIDLSLDLKKTRGLLEAPKVHLLWQSMIRAD